MPMAPLAAGVGALWFIASQVLNLDRIAGVAAPGALDDLAAATSQLASTPDFWLWFYLAFTVANTMFPQLPKNLSARQKSAAFVAAGACLLSAWRAAAAIELSLALAIERLTGDLALITLQIIVINIVFVVVLGTAEALIERVTGKSATFSDGRMLAMSRAAAQEWKAAQSANRRAARKRTTEPSKETVIASVYDLKLPIPGPPGREPVSRSIVAVMMDAKAETEAHSAVEPDKPTAIQMDAQPQAPPESQVEAADPLAAGQSRKERNLLYRRDQTKTPDRVGRTNHENAPFSRPFASEDSKEDRIDKNQSRRPDAADASPFSRPFKMRTRSDERSRLNTEKD